MIAALLLLLAQPTQIVERPDLSADRITVQLTLQVPALDSRRLSALDSLVAAISRGTQDYSRSDLLSMSIPGDAPQCTLMPDHVRISYSVPPGKMTDGMAIAESILQRAKMPEGRDRGPRPAANYWQRALQPPPAVPHLPHDPEEVYKAVFRPENLVVAVGGRFTAGQATSAWSRVVVKWDPPRKPLFPAEASAEPPSMRSEFEASTVELRGAVFAGTDPSLHAKILSLFALGSGKGSTMFRVLREEKGWSYRQESILWPDREGFRPRLLLAVASPVDVGQVAQEARDALLADIEKWQPSDLKRAQGMARGVLLYAVQASPFYLTGQQPIQQNLQDDTFLAAYWRIKTGRPWSPEGLLASFEAVSLEEIKAEASSIVSAAQVQVVFGGRG